MSCFFEEKAGRVNLLLQFKREQLLYDIKNYAYIEGHIMPSDTQAQVRHTVQDIGETGNVDRITRVLNLGVSQCKEMMYPYTKHEIYREALDDTLREPSVYGISLDLPGDFSQTTAFLLEKLVHEYLVCRAVADWMSIANPQKAEIWLTKADEAETEIRRSLSNRRNKARIKPHFL